MTLAAFWFIVLVVLWTGFFLLEGFDFGVGVLHGAVGGDAGGRAAAVRTIGPVWDGNEVWLIVAVAVTFAAFPDWYATMLSGFYPVFVVVLVALILRGVSFEFGAHAPGERGTRLWGAALIVGSLVAPLGLGIVLGGLLGGVPIDARQEFVGGIGDLFGPYALAVGATLLVLYLLHGAAFLALRTSGSVRGRALRAGRVLGPVAALAVLGFVVATGAGTGGAVLWSVPEFGAVPAVIAAAVLIRGERDGAAFAATSATVAAVVVSLFVELYPRVVVSRLGAAGDLTVEGAAASPYALRVMTVTLAVLLPAVLGYQGWSYHVFRGRIGGAGGAGPVPPPSGPQQPAGSDPRPEAVRPPSAGPASPRAMPRLVWLLVAWCLARLFARARGPVAPGR